MKRNAHSGNTTLEYGLVIGLVALSLYGLSTLGTAISGNLGTVAESNGTLSVLSPLEESSGGGSGGGSGGSIGTGMGEVSQSGDMAIFPDRSLAPENSGASIQVSGINGNELASIVIAKPIEIADKVASADKIKLNQQVVALGLKGQAIAGEINGILTSLFQKSEKKVKKGQKKAQSQQAQAQIAVLNAEIKNYQSSWQNIKSDQSGELQNMSSQDQATVTSLVQQSTTLMQNVVRQLIVNVTAKDKKDKKDKANSGNLNSNIANTSTTVNVNNQIVEDCGDGGC